VRDSQMIPLSREDRAILREASRKLEHVDAFLAGRLIGLANRALAEEVRKEDEIAEKEN
jgi:hypothetical protein